MFARLRRKTGVAEFQAESLGPGGVGSSSSFKITRCKRTTSMERLKDADAEEASRPNSLPSPARHTPGGTAGEPVALMSRISGGGNMGDAADRCTTHFHTQKSPDTHTNYATPPSPPQIGRWMPLATPASEPVFKPQPDAFRNRRRVLDKRRRKRGANSRPSMASAASDRSMSTSSMSSTHSAGSAGSASAHSVHSAHGGGGGGGDGQGDDGNDGAARTAAHAVTPAAQPGPATIPAATLTHGGGENVRRRGKRPNMLTRSQLTQSIYRVKRAWSMHQSTTPNANANSGGSRSVEDEAKALTNIMFTKYVAVTPEDEMDAEGGRQGAQETDLERMVREQEALFEEQLASTVAASQRAAATFAKLNADLGAKLDQRRVERSASVRRGQAKAPHQSRHRPYKRPSTLAERIARATASTEVEDTPENMGFGAVAGDITSSDDDDDDHHHGDDGGDGQTLPAAPGAVVTPPARLHRRRCAAQPQTPGDPADATHSRQRPRALPHVPAPWSKRWKPHALESWRQRRRKMSSYGQHADSSSRREHMLAGAQATKHLVQLRRVSG